MKQITIPPYHHYLANPWDKVGNDYTGSITPRYHGGSTLNQNCFHYRIQFYRPGKEDTIHTDPWFTCTVFDDAGKPDKDAVWFQKGNFYENVPECFRNPNYQADVPGDTNYLGYYESAEFDGTPAGLEQVQQWILEQYHTFEASGRGKIKVQW